MQIIDIAKYINAFIIITRIIQTSKEGAGKTSSTLLPILGLVASVILLIATPDHLFVDIAVNGLSALLQLLILSKVLEKDRQMADVKSRTAVFSAGVKNPFD